MSLPSVVAALVLAIAAAMVFAPFAAQQHLATSAVTAHLVERTVVISKQVRSPLARASAASRLRAGHISPNGVLADFPAPADAQAIAADLDASVFGSDGHRWFSEVDRCPDQGDHEIPGV
jgi:hypothetical protein